MPNQADTVEQQLREFICTEVLLDANYSLQADEPLISGGLVDSHSLVRIAVFIEDRFDVIIPDNELTVDNMDSVTAIAARVRSAGVDSAT